MGLDAYVYRNPASLHHRLGNISTISQLRSEILAVAQNRVPILLEKVVYEGAHAGDYLPLTEIDPLEVELDLLAEAAEGRFQLLGRFIEEMRELAAAAKAEKNPIYFG